MIFIALHPKAWFEKSGYMTDDDKFEDDEAWRLAKDWCGCLSWTSLLVCIRNGDVLFLDKLLAPWKIYCVVGEIQRNGPLQQEGTISERSGYLCNFKRHWISPLFHIIMSITMMLPSFEQHWSVDLFIFLFVWFDYIIGSTYHSNHVVYLMDVLWHEYNVARNLVCVVKIILDLLNNFTFITSLQLQKEHSDTEQIVLLYDYEQKWPLLHPTTRIL